MYVVTVEVATRRRLDGDSLRSRLQWFRPSIQGTSPGQQSVTLTVPAASPQQSAASGLRIVTSASPGAVVFCHAVAE